MENPLYLQHWIIFCGIRHLTEATIVFKCVQIYKKLGIMYTAVRYGLLPLQSSIELYYFYYTNSSEMTSGYLLILSRDLKQ